MLKTFVLSGLFAVIFSSFAFAGDLNAAFDSLKNLGTNFEPDGAVCEELEKVRLGQIYPADKFLISGDIEYSTGKETIGELDTVVIDRSTGKVVLLGEVKCWKNMEDGLMKAKSQMLRFFWNLEKHPNSLRFTSYGDTNITAAQVPLNTPFYTVGPQGSVAQGATFELNLTLKETQHLRMMLLKCQQNGECPSPQY
ncbi:hypothetical protein ACLVWU_07300 [Bdellovibrio sp. HCB290]|uniref:hypothetical protein n=1 Tax=Bdellovibrio sp. HCB290 TaxID=3394356 RepID=UPI0039B46A9E